MKQLFTLKDLLQEQLRDLYDAEMQYSFQLPSLIHASTSPELRAQLEEMAIQTRDNASQLKRACELMNVPADGVTCEAMNGLIREAKDTAAVWGDTATIDASIIANAQRIVHYEIAGFGTAREFANCLGKKDVAKILGELLSASVESDKSFTRIATGGWFSRGINHEAAQLAA